MTDRRMTTHAHRAHDRHEPEGVVVSTYVERTPTTLIGTCLACGEKTHQPDKGIGRANLAAWKTRHQHLTADPRATAREDGGAL